jgi:acetylornithine aminotransferase
MEPIQGESGVHALSTEYLQAVREICDQQEWLLMLDEVQTGNGRTGSYFAYQGMGVVPDVVTTAKGLGNGIPIGACLARGAAARALGAGQHGSTFGGSPLVCATALAVVKTITDGALGDNATAMGQLIVEGLRADSAAAANIAEIRGRGLMLGIQLHKDCGELVQRALDAGLLINVTAGNTIRLLPPLVINAREAQALAAAVAQLIREA